MIFSQFWSQRFISFSASVSSSIQRLASPSGSPPKSLVDSTAELVVSAISSLVDQHDAEEAATVAAPNVGEHDRHAAARAGRGRAGAADVEADRRDVVERR